MNWNEDVAELLRKGDPAQAVPTEVGQRVAAQLRNTAARSRSPRWDVRWVAAVAGCGAAVVLAAGAVQRQLRPPKTEPLPAVAASETSRAARSAHAALPSTLGEEAQLLNQALSAVEANSGREALRLVDEHARRFSRSELMRENRAVRVRALVSLGEDAAALEVLKQIPATSKTVALLSIEVQALARLGRCDELARLTASLEHPVAAPCVRK